MGKMTTRTLPPLDPPLMKMSHCLKVIISFQTVTSDKNAFNSKARIGLSPLHFSITLDAKLNLSDLLAYD